MRMRLSACIAAVQCLNAHQMRLATSRVLNAAIAHTCTCIRTCEHHLINVLCCSQGLFMQSCSFFRRFMCRLSTFIGMPPTINLTETGMPGLHGRRRPSFLSMLSVRAVLCFLAVNALSAAHADKLRSDASAAEAQLSAFKTQLAGARKLCMTNGHTCGSIVKILLLSCAVNVKHISS